MTASTVFSIANPLALLMWALMIFLPKWKVTQFLMSFKIIPILMSIVYVIYITISIQGNGMDFGSLASVMELFTKEDAVLAGWVHYLAFDLLVGMWIMQENEKVKLHHLLIIPCLFGCFMLGPVGFLLFTIFRTFKSK